MVKDGTRVDHVLSAFATKMYQIDNALKSSLDLEGGKDWSHALPALMKDYNLEVGEEGRAIEASFVR
jgi:flagellin-specific chaperone FliS